MRSSVLLLVAVGACASPDLARPRLPVADETPPVETSRRAAAPETPSLAGPLRLDALLPLLLERNPGIRAARARLEAAAQRRPQAMALPDPMVEATWFARNAMAPSNPHERYGLMIRQEIPFPTVLSLRGDEATKEAEAEALRYDAAVRDAVAELKDVEAERAYLVGAARVQAALADVYRRYADVARSGVAAGRTRLPESFRAEALLAQSTYETQLLDDMRRVEDQRLRALLALPTSVALGEPADVPPPPRLDVDVEALARRAVEHNQELRAAGVDVEMADVGARLARWAYAPTFTIGGGPMINDDIDMDSGRRRDSTVVTLGMSIPIWFGAREAGVREADAKARAARAAEAGERERVVADVARAAFRVRNSSRLAALYGGTLAPQAEQALLRSQASMREGGESLSSGLELAATWQQLRIAELRAVADESQAIAALERLLGTSLDAAPVETSR